MKKLKLFNKINRSIFILVVIIISSSVMAAKDLDAKIAAKIQSQLEVMVDNINHRITSEGKEYEVFINEKNEVDFRSCNDKQNSNADACTPRPNSGSVPDCQQLKRVEDQLPSEAKLICNYNKDYLMAVYRDDKKGVIRIVGRNKDDKELKLVKEISGKAIISVEAAPQWNNDYYFTFAVAEDSAYFPKKGVALIKINRDKGTIVEYQQPFSLKAKPISFVGDIYFVGLDQNLYTIKNFNIFENSRNEHCVPAAKLIWKNTDRLEVSEIGAGKRQCFLKLRDVKNGRDIYKLFSEDFECELSSEFNILNYKYLDTTNIVNKVSNDQKYGYDFDDSIPVIIVGDDSIAVVTVGDGYLPSRIYLMRWFGDYKPKQRFSVESVADAGEIGYKNVNFLKEVLDKVSIDADPINRKFNLDPEKYCQLVSKYDKDFSLNKFQLKLFKNFALDYKDIEFVKPYFTVVHNPKDNTDIPVNVWPAKGATAENPRPIIIYVHGGPNAHEDLNSPNYFPLMQYFAGKGYWVISPETRGSTGYGDRHEKALINHWGEDHIDDIIAVTDAFKTKSGIDSKKVFLMGHSFGGYSTLAAATRPDIANYFDGYAAICGVSEVGKNLKEVSEIKSEYGKRKDYLDSWDNRIGFTAATNHSINPKNIQISPLYRIETLNKPMLLIHGKNDSVVFPNQSEDFFWRAKDADKEVASVMLNNVGHDVGTYGHAVIPEKFFNEIIEDKCPAILSQNKPIDTEDKNP